jgi:beta-phosphoglucomutase-like phosphatase (HAD superfamily)
LKAEPALMLAVEDSPAGLESAKAAGCSGLSLGRAGRSRSFAFRGRPAVVVGAPFYVQ